MKHLPSWIIIWIMISTIIVLWDVMFVLLRPASFPNGSLSIIWIPYAKYIQVDTSYADLKNNFVIAQSFMSLIEIGIGLIALFLNYSGKLIAAILCAWSALLLTSAKTILIFILEAVSGFRHVGHNSLTDLICFYILPNALWIIIPLLAVFYLGVKIQNEVAFKVQKNN